MVQQTGFSTQNAPPPVQPPSLTPYQLKKRKNSTSGSSCFCGSTSHFIMAHTGHSKSNLLASDDTNHLLKKNDSLNDSMSSPTPPSPPPRVKGNNVGQISETLNTLFSELPCYSANHVDPGHQDHFKYSPSCGNNKRSKCKDFYRLFNSQINTQIGQLSSAYQKFRVNFWIDRMLLITGVYFPLAVGLLLVLIHAFLGVSKCLPNRESQYENFHVQSSYIDKACGLQLSFNILQGKTEPSMMDGKSPFFASGANLQQECYPFILIIIATLMWIPHKLCNHLIENNARRDLCFIKGELHSFRESLARELAVNNSCSYDAQKRMTPSHQNHGYQGSSSQSANSSQHPDPNGDAKSNCFSVIDTDFSSPGLAHLPDYVSCRNDWSLNAYLSSWQNADFYWIRYMTKHCILGFFLLVNFSAILTVTILNRGAPFVALFKCELKMTPSETPVHLVCMLQTTFLANMSVLIFGLLTIISLICQLVFFYNNFFQTHFLRIENTNRIGYRIDELSSINFSDRIKNDRARYFFGDYICLLAFATFKETNKEIRNMTVTISPKIFRTDFHMLSMMCIENVHLLPDALHIHFWMERYARLVKKRCTKPGWFTRRSNMGQLVRCEDLSMKFNFSKIGVKLEVIDFF